MLQSHQVHPTLQTTIIAKMLSIRGNGRISQTTEYLDCWLSDLLRNEVKNVETRGGGARAPVPHSWRHHWATVTAMGVDQVPSEFGVGR